MMPSHRTCRGWAAALALLAAAWAGSPPAGAALKPVSPVACRPNRLDYTFMWWAHGPPLACRGVRTGLPETSDAPPVLCIQTGRYGVAIDTQKVRLPSLGDVARLAPAADAVAFENAAVLALPGGDLALEVAVGGARYRCTGRTPDPKDPFDYPVRLIESGTLFQRADIGGLVFEDAAGTRLAAEGRLEIAAWPDRLAFILDVTPREDLADAEVTVRVSGRGGRRAVGGKCSLPAWKVGDTATVRVAWAPSTVKEAGAEVRVEDADTRTKVAVGYDASLGCYRVDLPAPQWTNASGTYYPEEQLDRLDRWTVRLANADDEERVVRLLVAMDRGHPAITGFTPMLRDAQGRPTGLPVQLSKNWHRKPDRPARYDGAWFHGFTLLRLPPRSATELEFALTYARWGGVAAASHAQLCLIGWGHNQRWDEAAIGSFGESICYEPDGAQRRCMIDDVRPLMVWQMGAERKKWGWTNNVGGGDFLVYFDEAGRYQHLARVRALYSAHGPNLTDVTYTGLTADGAIAARLNVATPRCDDVNRALHRFRYDVRKRTRPKRLAFYQLGADHYLWFQYGKIARGNAAGLVEEWQPKTGGWAYGRTGIVCEGDAPWFSLHESVSKDDKGGAWANRGLVIRSWQARLGGKAVPRPVASVFGTQDGVASAALELSAPPDLEELLPGDFVEAEVELVVMPVSADDYYGPNENLRAALKTGGNTWRMIHREAAGNHLAVNAARGRVERAYPLVVRVTDRQDAEFEVTGGVGYVPMTFVGLTDATGYVLKRREDGAWKAVNQAVHGNDFWQTQHDAAAGAWQITYNVPLDTPGDARRTVRFAFGRR